MPHKRLLIKFKAMGKGGEVYSWISDWLINREQRVVLLGKYSSWIMVKSGVPQGSVLGLLLFLIYINDIDDLINGQILKFADDTKLFNVVDNQEAITALQEDLDNLCEWSNLWLMPFTLAKCKIMHVGHNNTNAEYYLYGQYYSQLMMKGI